MANETNDRIAHDSAIHRNKYGELGFLNGKRFKYRIRNSFENNQKYVMPQAQWDSMKTELESFKKLVQWYVNDHYTHQLPRILELERYYLGDNNIHYWDSGKQKADNRIASGLPKYITDVRVGYQFGNPLVFGYSNQSNPKDDGSDLLNEVESFNSTNDIGYHDKLMAINMMNTGRAYELMYIEKDTNTVRVTDIDPNSCFVMWSSDVDPIELFAVRYYPVIVMGVQSFIVEVYTDTQIFTFTTNDDPASDWSLSNTVNHPFKNVPITEGILNKQRMGAWEAELDAIDARDQAISEMANSQEDFSNATLLVAADISTPEEIEDVKDNEDHQMYYKENGDYTTVATDEDGNQREKVKYVHTTIDTNANVLFAKPTKTENDGGGVTYAPVDIKYLTKQLNATDWKTYVDYLDAQIHKDTNVPDMSDQNFAGNVSGLAMDWKVWGADQERAISETNYTRMVMRRLRLLCIYLNGYSQSNVNIPKSGNNPADNVTITFTPNLPKDNQATMQIVQGLLSAGVSHETILDQVSKVTGVSVETEEQRLETESAQTDQRDIEMANQLYSNQSSNNQPVDDEEDDADDDGYTDDEPNVSAGGGANGSQHT